MKLKELGHFLEHFWKVKKYFISARIYYCAHRFCAEICVLISAQFRCVFIKPYTLVVTEPKKIVATIRVGAK